MLMENANGSVKDYFIIKGISDSPELQFPIFLLVLLIYIITFGSNMAIILLVYLDRHLHTPMYFFLCNLSFLDIFCSTSTFNKFFFTFAMGDKTISYISCMLQMYFSGSFTFGELLFLTAMSYDRYVAICNPLRYMLVMSVPVCSLLAAACWVMGFLEMIPLICVLTRFTCYRSKIINHFFCESAEVLKVFCDRDTFRFELLLIVEGALLGSLVPFLLKCVSYGYIITTIMRIRSSGGRRKAFYTCSSHLTVVMLLYMTLSYQYLRPSTKENSDNNKLFSLFNTAAIPILNPLIYSLKNKDIKAALRRQLTFL